MWETDKDLFDKQLRKVVEEESFIEEMKIRYGVPRPVIRKLIIKFGSSPQVFDEFRQVGYSINDLVVREWELYFSSQNCMASIELH